MADALIIAICGESGAGKSTTTKSLENMGFKSYSLSGFLRQEAEEALGVPTRIQVQQHGKAMQEQHGNAYYAQLLDQNSDLFLQSHAVMDGLRNEDELAYLRNRAAQAGASLKLLALVVDSDVRFQRVTGRARAGDPTAREQFAADDARANGAEGAFQNNQRLIEMADWKIDNTGDMESLRTSLLTLVNNWTAAEPGSAQISHQEASR